MYQLVWVLRGMRLHTSHLDEAKSGSTNLYTGSEGPSHYREEVNDLNY